MCLLHKEVANSRDTEVFQPTKNTVEGSKRMEERATNRTKRDRV